MSISKLQQCICVTSRRLPLCHHLQLRSCNRAIANTGGSPPFCVRQDEFENNDTVTHNSTFTEVKNTVRQNSVIHPSTSQKKLQAVPLSKVGSQFHRDARVQLPPQMTNKHQCHKETHDENDIQTAASWDITSSNSKKNQVSQPPTSGDCHPMTTSVMSHGT